MSVSQQPSPDHWDAATKALGVAASVAGAAWFALRRWWRRRRRGRELAELQIQVSRLLLCSAHAQLAVMTKLACLAGNECDELPTKERDSLVKTQTELETMEAALSKALGVQPRLSKGDEPAVVPEAA